MIFESDEQRKEAVDWLTAEVPLAEVEMEGRKKKWDRWRRQREALPEFPSKTWPGSNRPRSNVVPPVSLTNTNNVFSNLHNKFNLNPFWNVSSVKVDVEEDVAIAKFWTKYLDILAQGRNDLNRRKKAKIVHYETGSLGYCAVKVPWSKRQWLITEQDPETGLPVDKEVTLHEGPSIEPIPAEDFLIREAYQDIQTAPWCAHVLHKTWPEIQQAGELGLYENVDELENWARGVPTEADAAQQEREGATQLSDSDIWDLHEFYFFFKVHGKYRDCLATIELNSGTVLRESFNELGWREIEDFSYLLRPFRREGMGVGHMSDHMQEEATLIHNARNDATVVSVIPMFAARKQSGPKEGEAIYPAKIWMLDDPGKDLTVIKLPEPGTASLMVESGAVNYAQRAVGFGDASGGFADNTVKTRDSPGLMERRIRQSGGVFEAVSEGVEDSWGMVGYLTVLQLIHHKDEVLARETQIGRLTAAELRLLGKALDVPKEEVPIRLRFSIKTSDVEETFEVKRQNLLTRTQLSAMFFQQTFPVVQMLFGPQGQQIMKSAPQMWKYLARIYTSRCRMMEEAIRFFGEDDTGKYVPDYKKLESLLDFQRMLENQQMGGSGVGTGTSGGGRGGFASPAGAGQAPAFALAGGQGIPAAAGNAGGAAGGSPGAGPEPGVGGLF